VTIAAPRHAGSSAAAANIVAKLQAAGIRATTDPGALNPPAVLVVPPRRVYDVGCGYTATWTLHAIAPAPTGGDRTTWTALDVLVDAVAASYPVQDATPGAYVLGPNTHPSYLVTFTEVISDDQ
jgi:hypothetical protein